MSRGPCMEQICFLLEPPGIWIRDLLTKFLEYTFHLKCQCFQLLEKLTSGHWLRELRRVLSADAWCCPSCKNVNSQFIHTSVENFWVQGGVLRVSLSKCLYQVSYLEKSGKRWFKPFTSGIGYWMARNFSHDVEVCGILKIHTWASYLQAARLMGV